MKHLPPVVVSGVALLSIVAVAQDSPKMPEPPRSEVRLFQSHQFQSPGEWGRDSVNGYLFSTPGEMKNVETIQANRLRQLVDEQREEIALLKKKIEVLEAQLRKQK